MTSTERVMDRIRKLQAMADGASDVGNQEEALAFASKVQELLLEHKFTMSEVMFRRLDQDDPMGESPFNPDELGLRKTKSRLLWREMLGDAVGKAHFCQFFIVGKSAYCYAGRESDRQVACYMFAYLISAAESLARKGYRKQRRNNRENTRGFKVAFYHAFAEAIQERYWNREREIREKGFAGVSSGTALVRVQNSKEAVVKWIAENMQVGRAGKGPGRRNTSNQDGLDSGRAAGHSVNLDNKGVGTTQGRSQIGG